MTKLDFASVDTKTALRILKAFANFDQWRLRPVFESFWKDRETLERAAQYVEGGTVDKDGMVTLPFKNGIIVSIWVQGRHYLLSLDFHSMRQPTLFGLFGMVGVMKALERLDYPVKIDKGDTITLKAAVAVAALAVAQGCEGVDGIVMDMARDKEI